MACLQTTLTSMAGAAIVLPWLLIGQPARGDDAAAREQLIGHGLTKFRSYWICRDEVDLRRQFKLLPQVERRFYAAQDVVRVMLTEYDRYQEQLKQLAEAIERSRQRLSRDNLNPLARKKLDNEVRRQAAAAAEIADDVRKNLNGLDEGSPLTEATVRLASARTSLTLVLLAIDRHATGMSEQYDRLGQNEAIARALGAMSPVERLGPAEPYEVQERRRLERLSKAVFSDHVPVYRRGNRYRLSVIVGDETPATFSYMANQTWTLIPTTLVHSAGIDLDENAPFADLPVSVSRKIRVQAVKIPKLRIGKYVLEDVPALVFDPEGEDVGAILGRNALADYRVELDPRRLDFRMTPLE